MRAELNFEPDARPAAVDPDDKPEKPRVYLGADGEGIGRNPHRYVLLAVAQEPLGEGESGALRRWYVENSAGLSTLECLRFFANLPTQLDGKRAALFAYSFNYDLTKILQDMDEERLYRLFRPELRKRTGELSFQGPTPVLWQGYSLNLIGSKFTIKGPEDRLITLWDVWKFYQGKFVTALKDWKVGTGETIEETNRMKELRSKFQDSDMPAIREYCFSECRDMATLAHKLVDAHNAAGLKLTSFYGAGSTASAMLKVMGIREKLKPTYGPMREAVAAAFFGGRFENSVVGEIVRPVKNYDISSAYPYQTCFLPCLLHGTWDETTQREDLAGAEAACIQYVLHRTTNEMKDWAPFPYRTSEGSICFPSESGGGWVWKEEFLAGERFCEKGGYTGAIEFKKAYIYRNQCGCEPFASIPHYYRERCRIGKEGAGIVFKLGPNSVYGKLAQSVGSARFQSWTWAGMITSGCRAQLLDLIALHKTRSDVLMVATDGLFSTNGICTCPPSEKSHGCTMGAPIPKPTGTAETGKPLGGWECGDLARGIFAARPGIYFPLNPTKDDIAKVKGRGVGKGTILDNHAAIVAAFREHGVTRPVAVKDIERFCGGKTSISFAPGKGTFTRAGGGQGANGQDMPFYGEWIKRRVEMSFDPRPKRDSVLTDGIHLKLRTMPMNVESVPYQKALRNTEADTLAAATVEISEQPDGDLTDSMEDLAS